MTEQINYQEEQNIKRAIAVRQYRFLLKMIKEAKRKEFYALATAYQHEAEALKIQWQL